MSESPYIHNVGLQNFQQLVLEKSMTCPVLVDFWADWCQPCQTIMPMLAKLAEEYDGKFELAKVNADAEQELAGHFGIKSLPTMKLFFKGQLVDERIGAVPESEVRAMLDKHIVSESEQIMQAAMTAYQQGQAEQALELLNQALAKDPENAELKVTIAQVVYGQGNSERALALLDSLDEAGNKLDAAIKLRAEMNLAAQLADLPELSEIEQRLQQNPKDLEALLQKSRHLTAQGDYENAMQCLLEIMRIDRGFDEDAGRNGLLALFDMLGGEHPSVQKYRRKLFTLLH
ncbi:MAG: thioredoxin [Gammaproteobacteria bacterium]|nr:thioredoxin [Gammaproteobacteria bacterium]MDH3535195.1 thioredoxin [Gammaproteobacteria bacterium]